jgi:multidrug efflux pump subunit AcrB
MSGYNYEELLSYANALKERLIVSGKQRIKEVYLLGGGIDNYYMFGREKKRYRNMLEMNKYFLIGNNSNITDAFMGAYRYSRNTAQQGNIFVNGTLAPLSVRALQSEEYDYWNLINAPMETYSGSFVRMKDFSSVKREITNSSIGRQDQQYVITVTFDFIGNNELGNLILKRNVDETNGMLPLGYSAKIHNYFYSWNEKGNNYYLIFLVIAIIYFVCAILLESFKQPLIVISLIPFSFIGLFITFHVFKIVPDEGVFAAMILLCGIVVNATLYILNDYNILRRKKPDLPERLLYVKAFNGKIIPIFLTKLSTIIGLVPFLLSGKDERFWFALAAGTIGGLVFSFIGLLVYQPMMLRQGAGSRGKNGSGLRAQGTGEE